MRESEPLNSHAWAQLDQAALHHNVREVRRRAPRSKMLAMVKANAYGHGFLEMAIALERFGADALGVATVSEGWMLRERGIRIPVVVLQGAHHPEEWVQASAAQLQLAVHDWDQIHQLEQQHAQCAQPIELWIDVNTGMNRLGFFPHELEDVLSHLERCARVRPTVLMSHFMCADEQDSVHNVRQKELFFQVSARYPHLSKSLANSAAICSMSDAHLDWVRPGIMLYGISPDPNRVGTDWNLSPVMRLYARLIATRLLQPGEVVGYGARFQSETLIRMGVARIGYGDGYPRHAPSGTPASINGADVSLMGTVSMDMTTWNIDNSPEARVGSVIELWGTHVPVEVVARHAQTIAYELTCGLGNRVHCLPS